MTQTDDAEVGTYAWDNGWAEARRRLELLEQVWDPVSFVSLGQVPVQPGWRCLEIGGGYGSIVRWLCDAVGPQGKVVTVDLDTRFLRSVEAANLEVIEGDVVTGGLPAGPFDFAHTRAVLMHIPARDELLAELINRLRPGGTLLLEEFDFYAMEASLSPFYRSFVLRAAEILRTAVGMQSTWARALPQRLCELGLTDVRARATTSLFRGGSPEAEFWRISWTQVQDVLLAGGLDKETFEQVLAIFDDDMQWLPAPANVTVSGRLPG
ncbi:MAG: class I SAM-dependent methyltransferase [Actinobacteria bacterium]|nr:class I SAM-dependent methyltransferase [Actinomycetota bacterium]